MTPESLIYDVFISYRTSRSPDREIAEALQKVLENYPVPASLRHQVLRPAPLRLPSRLRVFRDSSDLTAAPDLWEAIRYALIRSRWLIVVCSPGAPESRWVSKEIAAFQEARGWNRIIAVLVEGEPDAAIPRLLRRVTAASALVDGSTTDMVESLEPLASDLRAPDVASALETLSGRRRAKEKQKRFEILAPILGLGSPDELVQRHRARTRRQALYFSGGLFVVASVVLWSVLLARVADAKANEQAALARAAGQEKIAAEARTREATARADLEKQAKMAAQQREEIERAGRVRETVFKHVSEGYRHRFADPFTAAAEAYRSRTLPAISESDTVLEAVHEVLLERRGIYFRERNIVKPAGFSFSSQMTSGPRFTKVSQDGTQVLVVTERKGEQFKPELRGEAYVLNNRTLRLVKLDECRSPDNYLLEFADFVGSDKVLVARAFEVYLYTVQGKCLGNFTLQHTKTPVTAASGMLHDVFFIVGNGAGCVWMQEYGRKGLIPPAENMSAVKNCDEKRNPNAVIQILVNPAGSHGIDMFHSGRIDLFTASRRLISVIPVGGRAAAFRPGGSPVSFAVAYAQEGGTNQKLVRLDIHAAEVLRVGDFALDRVGAPIDYLGFSADGQLLIGIDGACALHYWDYKTRESLYSRAAGKLSCQAGAPDL